MSTTTDSVDQIFKVTVDGVAYVLKLVTIGAPALVRGGAALTGYIHGKFTGDSKLKGEVSVNSMLRRGQGLAYYMVADRDLEKFQSSVKKSTLLYGITDQFKTDNGKAVHQIIVPRDQVPLLNEIIRFNRLNVVKHAEMEQVSAQPLQTKETREHEVSGVSVTEKTNSEKNKEFISHICAQIKEREWGGTPEEPTVNPPTAARTEAAEHLSAVESKKTDSRKDPSRPIQETGELPSIKGRDEPMQQIAMRPVEDFLSPAYCENLEKARWADAGKRADILVDLNGNRQLEIWATIIEPIYEYFDTATNFYGFDDTGKKYPLFTTDSRTVAPYQKEKVFKGSMEDVKQYLSERGVSQLISESDYIKQTEVTEHSIVAEPQKTDSLQNQVKAAQVTGERPSIRGKVEMLKKDVAKQPDLEISHDEPKIDLPEVEK